MSLCAGASAGKAATTVRRPLSLLVSCNCSYLILQQVGRMRRTLPDGNSGKSEAEVALPVRRRVPAAYQPPPRLTRPEPAEEAVHWNTLPCMSHRPSLFSGYEPTR